ncbi:MAG: hypothetical protein A3J83_05850 [Elusimicrobia bacterium RIFOXYA2_FULL_40_6]|nr:MAG: hypothetical protein A3J83_05850 [Elusimicrobia bacterium RIFOXYA2_FULL_40_6]
MKKKKINSGTFLKEHIDTIYKVTGLSIVIQNYSYFRKTDRDLHIEDSYAIHRCNFCMTIKKSKVEDKACIVYERKLSGKACGFRMPFFTKCRFGIEDVHLPILDKNEFLGSIACGQVFMEKPSKDGFHKIVKTLLPKSQVDIQKLRSAYFKTPHITREVLDDIVNRVEILSRYIVEKHGRNKLQQMLRKESVKDTDIEATSRQELLVKKAIEFIETNFTKNITRDDVSRQVYLNPAYFSRLFHEITGKSFTDHLIEMRLNKAKLLMRNPLISIKEAAFRVGFENQYYFSRLFKKKEGSTPKTYRESLS